MKLLIILFAFLLISNSTSANNVVVPVALDTKTTVNEITPLTINVVSKQKNKSFIPKKLTKTIENINQLQLSYNLENRLGYLKFVFKF